MSETPSSSTAEPEWAAFVALDWGDQKHYWKLRDAMTGQDYTGKLENKPEALETWARELRDRYQGKPIAICLEQARGGVVYQLGKYSHLMIYPAHPATAAHFRQALCPSGSKSDEGDTAVLLDLLLHHRDRLHRLEPDTVATRQLQMLVEQRRRFVADKTRHSNRLTQCLKDYYPQVLDWIDDIDSPLGCDLLKRWPTLSQLKRAHPGTLRKFFREHNCRSEERIRQRIEAIYKATEAVHDTAIVKAGVMTVTALIAVIEALRNNVEQFTAAIGALVREHPEAAQFAGLPGAGPALLPRLIAAFGTKRERYQSAAQLQAYAGIAPLTEQSGQRARVHFRRSCPKFLRQTFHEFAAHSIAKSVWARAYYQMLRDKGKRHHAAVRALAYKWIRVLFRCWKNGVPYDEETYLQALNKRRSPLAEALRAAYAVPGSLTGSETTRPQWKSVAGFQKFTIAGA